MKLIISLLTLTTVLHISIIAQTSDELKFLNIINKLSTEEIQQPERITELYDLYVTSKQYLDWKNTKTLHIEGSVVASPIIIDRVYLQKGIVIIIGKNYRQGEQLDNGTISLGTTQIKDALYIPIPKKYCWLREAWVENATDVTYMKYLFGIEIGNSLEEFRHTRRIIPYCVLQVDIESGKIEIIAYNDNRFSMENEYYD